MIEVEEIKRYLPKYLSPESTDQLFSQLKDFDRHIDGSLYTYLHNEPPVVYQGDALRGLLVIRLPADRIEKLPCLVLSNTCDIHPENPRFIPSNIAYSPIIRLSKYQQLLAGNDYSEESIESHLSSIRRERITSIFYLPPGQYLTEECIVFLDHVCSCSPQFFKDYDVEEERLFTLSDFGLYLFLFKLSVHYCRINESIDRRNMSQQDSQSPQGPP